MAYAKRTDAQWVEIDPATLPDPVTAVYKTYKELYAQAKAARQLFEDTMSREAKVPDGKRMVFGYNFGKLSVAIVEDDKPKRATPAKRSLAEYMADMQARGERC